jgi:NAD(P)-dependent dehydrogenase (short-subunit alcohol dehydrogenase family)
MKKDLPVNENIIEFIPVIRMLLSEVNLKILQLRYNSLNKPFITSRKNLETAIVHAAGKRHHFWDGKFIYLEETSSPEKIIFSFIKESSAFRSKNLNPPELIIIKDYGVLGIGDTAKTASLVLDEFEEFLQSLAGSETQSEELKKKNPAIIPGSEKVRNQGILSQKICIVTGGAQGFGEGISRSLINEDANLVIADVNEEKGLATKNELQSLCDQNELVFIKTDVSDPDSVKNLIVETVKKYGGIDIFISNAGILMAGGLDEMEPADFELMTKINYEGYFLCVRYASVVLKLQAKYKEEYYSDIIQINSKSGLKGSNRNFAYSGGKFGGIGLTQSFALELAPHRIKVNAICPGNFFEGPLWADPEKGLFVQYLKAGKVPGAKTTEDVKRFYEKRVPLGRGCRVQDVMKAILYIVSQEYETGQAVPVTGGQEMLS